MITIARLIQLTNVKYGIKNQNTKLILGHAHPISVPYVLTKYCMQYIQIMMSAQMTQACRHWLKDTIYWHDYAALCHFININLNSIVNKLLQLIPTLTEQNIRLCIVILLGCSYSRCAEMLLLSKSSISKLKQIMAEKLGTDIKNLRATLLDIACKNG